MQHHLTRLESLCLWMVTIVLAQLKFEKNPFRTVRSLGKGGPSCYAWKPSEVVADHGLCSSIGKLISLDIIAMSFIFFRRSEFELCPNMIQQRDTICLCWYEPKRILAPTKDVAAVAVLRFTNSSRFKFKIAQSSIVNSLLVHGPDLSSISSPVHFRWEGGSQSRNRQHSILDDADRCFH